MPRNKIIRIKHCVDCPLAECTREGVTCLNAALKDEEYVGSIEHVIGDYIIPDWCPLEEAK